MHEKPIFSEYFDTITSNGYITKITFPTRITDTTQTLIDNIPVKMSHNYSETTAGILTHQISDHMPYFITLDYIKCSTKSAKYLKVFNKNLQSLNAFKIEIGNLNLPTKLHQNLDTDPNLNYKIVSDYISCAFEKHLPIEILKLKKYKHKKNKWLTQGILNSLKFRDRLYKLFHSTDPNHSDYNTRKINLQTYNRILKQNIRQAKKLYYVNHFNKVKNCIKKTWLTINEILCRNNKNTEFPSHFLINNEPITNMSSIANEFNKYFTNIGPKLASTIHNLPGTSFIDYLNQPIKK